MRTIVTVIVRLFVDSDSSTPLRGALQAVPDGDMTPFTDDLALLALLRKTACANDPPPAVRNDPPAQTTAGRKT